MTRTLPLSNLICLIISLYRNLIKTKVYHLCLESKLTQYNNEVTKSWHSGCFISDGIHSNITSSCCSNGMAVSNPKCVSEYNHPALNPHHRTCFPVYISSWHSPFCPRTFSFTWSFFNLASYYTNGTSCVFGFCPLIIVIRLQEIIKPYHLIMYLKCQTLWRSE